MAKQHYLAQCYLRRGFATREDQSPAVWQYRKSSSELRKRGVRNVAHRPGYYSREFGGQVDDSIETFFGRIETHWPSVYDLIDRFAYSATIGRDGVILPQLTPEKKIALLSFMFIHTLRGPPTVERVRNRMADTLPNEVTPSDLNNMLLTSMEGFLDREMPTFLRNNFEKTLCVYVLPAGSQRNFVTTDKPVTYYTDADGPDKPVKLLFPISRRVVIVFAPMNNSDPVRMRVLHRTEDMDQLNRIIIRNAADEIYAREPLNMERLLHGMGYSVNRHNAPCPE